MITEDYVSFETAKLLKKKGYWNIATTLYKENGDIVNYNVPLNNKGFSSTLGVFYEAPTLQMAIKWLREVHKIAINIEWKYLWYATIKPMTSESMGAYVYDSYVSDSYEGVCELAIKYCLENLI